MKILISLLAVILLASCHRAKRHTIVSTSSDHHFQKAEWTGWISFNKDKTSILSMSPNAYFKYETSDEELDAKSDSAGRITYALVDGTKTQQLTPDNKRLLAQAINFITVQEHLPQLNNGY